MMSYIDEILKELNELNELQPKKRERNMTAEKLYRLFLYCVGSLLGLGTLSIALLLIVAIKDIINLIFQ